MSRMVSVPWTLRAQPETTTSPAQPKRRVEVLMEPDTYRLFAVMRAKVWDGEKLLLAGDELQAALHEMHNLVEMVVFCDGQVISQPAVEVQMTEDSRTEVLAAVESLEAKGWHMPEKLKAKLAEGQTSILDERPITSDEKEEELAKPF